MPGKTICVVMELAVLLGAQITAAQDFWEETNGPYVPFRRTIFSLAVASNGVIYAGATCWEGEYLATTLVDNVIYRSVDYGDHWVETALRWSDLNIDYVFSLSVTSTGNVFALTDNGTYRSTDSGDHWYRIGPGNQSIASLALDATGGVFAGTNDGIYFSTDNGDHWVQVGLRGRSIESLAIGIPGEIFAGTDSGIYRSTDSGESWAFRGLQNVHVHSLALDSSGNVFAGGSTGASAGAIFRSNDRGNHWEQVLATSDPELSPVHSIVVNNTGEMFAVVGAPPLGTIYRSVDNGSTWHKFNSGLMNIHACCLAVTPSGDVLTGTQMWGIYRLLGTTWQRIGLIHPSGMLSLALDPKGRIFAGFEYIYDIFGVGGFFSSTDNGQTWADTILSNHFFNAFAFSPSGYIYASVVWLEKMPFMHEQAIGCLRRSADGGHTWTETTLIDTTEYFYESGFPHLAAVPGGGVFAAAPRKGLYRSTDEGNTWTQIGPDHVSIQALAIDSSGTIFAGTYQGIYSSTNNGSSWTYVRFANSCVYSIAIAPWGQIFAGTDTGLYCSTDNGNHWVMSGLAKGRIRSLALDPQGYIFAGTFGDGVFLSTDRGSNWVQMNSGLTDPSVVSFAVDPSGYIFVATLNGHVFRSAKPIRDVWEIGHEMPSEFRLHQNYPNPLSPRGASAYGGNPSTTITFDLPQRTSVKLVVYDVLGREVKTLVDEEKAPGTYEVKFSAAELPSRIYFYKLTAGQFSAVRKMIVMR